MGPLGFNEILIILIIVLLLFGGKKIPELMRGLGRGMREFNDAKNNVRKEIEDGINEKEQKPVAPSTTTTTSSPS
jgi:sec-independent protein translocase protein TatA